MLGASFRRASLSNRIIADDQARPNPDTSLLPGFAIRSGNLVSQSVGLHFHRSRTICDSNSWSYEQEWAHPDPLFFVDRKGILSCLEATSGELIWKHRLDGNYSSSPVFANNRIYFFNEEGAATVIKPARKFELLAENKLNNETMMASPAIAGDSFFLRTDEHLYRIDSETSK